MCRHVSVWCEVSWLLCLPFQWMFSTHLYVCVFVITVLSVDGDPQTIHMCAFLSQYLGSGRNLSFYRQHLSHLISMVVSAELSTFLSDAGAMGSASTFLTSCCASVRVGQSRLHITGARGFGTYPELAAPTVTISHDAPTWAMGRTSQVVRKQKWSPPRTFHVIILLGASPSSRRSCERRCHGCFRPSRSAKSTGMHKWNPMAATRGEDRALGWTRCGVPHNSRRFHHISNHGESDPSSTVSTVSS